LPHPLTAEVESLCRRVALPSSLEVKSVQLFTHRIPMTVQVMVQRLDGGDVTLEECALLSAPLGEALEAADLLEAPYVLEVSSPGIGEDLRSDRDFTSFRGFPVEVVLKEASGGRATREGLLLGRDGQAVQLNVRGRTVRLPREEVVQVRLVTPADSP
jgi:ribosome maturation factor RimP